MSSCTMYSDSIYSKPGLYGRNHSASSCPPSQRTFYGITGKQISRLNCILPEDKHDTPNPLLNSSVTIPSNSIKESPSKEAVKPTSNSTKKMTENPKEPTSASPQSTPSSSPQDPTSSNRSQSEDSPSGPLHSDKKSPPGLNSTQGSPSKSTKVPPTTTTMEFSSNSSEMSPVEDSQSS